MKDVIHEEKCRVMECISEYIEGGSDRGSIRDGIRERMYGGRECFWERMYARACMPEAVCQRGCMPEGLKVRSCM